MKRNGIHTFFNRNLILAKLISIRYLSEYFPKVAAHIFSGIWFKVSRPNLNPKRDEWISKSIPFEVSHRGKKLPVYVRRHEAFIGQVVLIHGWSGRWDQLIKIGDALHQKGFEIVFFDLPSHGENIGDESDIFEFSEFLKLVDEKLNLLSPIVICHSAGFLTIALAKLTKGFPLSKLVTINSPAKFDYLIEVFEEKIRFSSRLIPELWKIVDKRAGVVDAKTQLDTHHMASIDSKSVLIFHDQNDKEVLVSQAEEMKKIWREARFIKTQGLGHNRILADQMVIDEISSFCLGNKSLEKN
ncbi:alpha/beta hydrolase [Bacteriovorax sp. PP10]|uniref:Alpha/beta hydrolase n=1 Tax=Bacteriovorax antarcticus TaxID=3088717 RepID=A0ABU5VTN0_9BACT|nr:alpha/beta hydrolase [Bacteriovorax sp. PP10]MEA9355967.1 alpha/beta hydrolase [Bacteriovorax sp. PP10]